MMNIVIVTSIILLLNTSMIRLCGVSAISDAMARPTRPKVFTSIDELKRYLDHVLDYYSLTGKARYGKRSSQTQEEIDSPTYIPRENFFTDGVSDDVDDTEELNKIIKQSSDPVIPEWLTKLKTLRIDRQGKIHGIHQWI